ncbi:hypothetical protein C0995_002129 [Termitomyces sp. Mi166|nr:hypothetical protein C0995_002129 [Termitomyces sp. Mi166\
MGSAPSKQQPPSIPTVHDEKRAQLSADLVADMTSLSVALPVSPDGSLTKSTIASWESDAASDSKTVLARTILQHSNITTALTSRPARISDVHVFNNVIDFKTGPVTNQKSSGRCWIFASTNVFRYAVMKALKLSDFQLSQSYLFFWDKLNKANYYLELSIQHADLPIDDRLINHLSGDLVSDGGQWDMIVNLVERYGLVPQVVFPESTHSSLSGPLNTLVKTKLREHALILRRLSSSLRASFVPEDILVSTLRAKKEDLVKEIYIILTATLGVPPAADESFTWEYADADGKFGKWKGTPLEFAKAFASKPYPVSESFSLINDPRNPYSKLYTVDKLGNVWGARPVLYVNSEIDNLKSVVVKSIKAGHPVFFGCDVGKFSETAGGIMDTALFQYELAFDITLGLTKAERLQVNESAMTHAMVISGVHLDDNGKPIRYKVENSWGDANGDKGYFVMTDAWFEQFVYQVVVPKAYIPKALVEVYESGEKVVLPPWDPMLKPITIDAPGPLPPPIMNQRPARRGLSFLAMIGGAMAALKLKQHWDEQYNPLASDEEGRVALTSAPLNPVPPYVDHEGDEAIVGLDPEIRPMRKRKSGCCVCCGLDCSLFWKAFGIVAVGFAIWNSVKLIIWAVSDAPTGLELMPAFSSSLGCLAAPHVYNNTKVVMTAQVGPENDHSFDFRGSAVGTFVITQGASDLKDVKYEMTLRTGDETLLQYINIIYPDFNEDGSISSRLVVSAPRAGPDTECMRFDIIMYIPPTLKKLHVVSHATTHVQFAPDAKIELESFYITLFAMDQNNLILPSQTVRSHDMALELIRGWIVGDVAILNSTSITTQQGDGVTNLRAHPTAPSDPEHPSPVTLRTTTGAGRTDIFYISSKVFKRQIDNVHLSSRNADMYLTYKDADFSGRVGLDSKSYTTTGLHRFENVSGGQTWTHWAGDKNGADQIFVRSRGWSGLYL